MSNVKFQEGDFLKIVLPNKQILYGQVYHKVIYVTRGKYKKRFLGFEEIMYFRQLSPFKITKISYRAFRKAIPDERIGNPGTFADLSTFKICSRAVRTESMKFGSKKFVFGCGAVKLTDKQLEMFADYLDPNSEFNRNARMIEILMSRNSVQYNPKGQIETVKAIRSLIKRARNAEKKALLRHGKR